MRRLRRPARIGAWAMLVVAAASLLLGGLSLVGVWWSKKRSTSAGLIRGDLLVRYWDAQWRMTGTPPGWTVGPAGRRISLSGFSAVRIKEEKHASWFGSVDIFRGGLVPLGAPPVAPGPVLGVHMRIRLLPVAGFAAALGGILWFVSRQRVRPGACAPCGYDLAGLGPGSACPECGHGVPGGVRVVDA